MAAKMKQNRRWMVLLCAALFASTAQGQEEEVHLGLAIAPNWSHGISRDYAHEALEGNLRFGYKFIFDWKFTDTYAIGSGVNVFHTGGTVGFLTAADTSTLHFVEWGVHNQYVEVPITFKMRTKEVGYTTYFGQFGVGLGLNVRSEVDARSYVAWGRADQESAWAPLADETGGGEPIRMAFDEQTRLFRPSLIVGLGAERALLGKTALCMGLAYNMGLSNQYVDQTIVRTNTSGMPIDVSGTSFGNGSATGAAELIEMQGKTGFLELTLGLMF